ncbi:MAG: hypothetical protein LBE37_11150 [Sphingobacterium sp.]|jgi:hypothetical protein|nr:hypothetical protein [Sphingobacterium sp.]
MFKNYTFSKNPLHYVYAAIWLSVFVYFAIYLFTGKMFQPENGKIHIVAVLIAWVVEYLGLTLTSIIVVLCGVYAALRTMLEKKVTA